MQRQMLLMGQNGSSMEKYLLEDVSKLWLQYRKGEIRESTYALYYQKVHRYIIPDLGKTRLKDLTETQLNDFIEKQLEEGGLSARRGLSWKTVSDLRSVLGMILEWAAKNGFPEVGSIKLHMPPVMPQELEVLSTREQRKLEKYLLNDMNEVRLGPLLSLYTGLRIGEVCGLKWGDVDFKRGTLSVRRTVMRIQETNGNSSKKTKVMITTPKTYCSNRTVPIPADIIKLLEPFQGESEVFVLSGSKECMEPRILTGHYKKILKSAGLDSYRYHALRHTFATRCVEQGIDIKTLSEIMGHSSVKITMDRYVHPSMDYKKKQVNRLHLNKEAVKKQK